MKITLNHVFFLIITGMVVFACLFRYTIIPANSGGDRSDAIVYKLDRWTGNVEAMQGPIAVEVALKQK